MDKTFRVPVYNFKVHVTDFDHAKQVEDLWEDIKSLGGAVYWYQGKLCMYVATDWLKLRKRIGEFVTHESIHAAFEILKTCGIKVDESNHEALAYLTEYIYSKVTEILFREKDKYEKGSRL